MVERGVTPADSGCKMVKVHQILYHSLIVLHLESFKLIFHIFFRVVGSEVVLEFWSSAVNLE